MALCCLDCQVPMAESAAAYRCPECGRQYACEDGIVLVEGDRERYYWGEVKREELSAMNDRIAAGRAWRDEIAQLAPDPRSLRRRSVCDPARANWLDVTAPAAHGAALDIGCGMGMNAIGMSRRFETVWALDAIFERLRFTTLRLRQERIGNVRPLFGSVFGLPFAEESLDLVLLNGILEWVGEWDYSAPPRAVQERVLRRVHELLRPGGNLVVGIENRFSYSYLYSGRDHSGYQMTSYMPRAMATAYMRLMRRLAGRRRYFSDWASEKPVEYRTYTYTVRGYRRLLREAGFAEVHAYYCYPNYNFPHKLLPLDDRAALRQSLKMLARPGRSIKATLRNALAGGAAACGLLPYVVPGYTLVAVKR